MIGKIKIIPVTTPTKKNVLLSNLMILRQFD